MSCCKDAGLLPDVLHTSVLQKRAIRTAQLALEAADRHWIPVHRSWRLNERHYGALQGKDKAQTLAEFGEEQFMLWRRSYDTPPPPLADGTRVLAERRPALRDDPAGAAPAHRVPQGRRRRACCRTGTTASSRTCSTGRTVLVAAHGNSLRALVKHLDGISDADIAGLNIPTGIPLVYELDADFKPGQAGRHLPRPGRGRRRDRGRQEPGQEVTQQVTPVVPKRDPRGPCSARQVTPAATRAPRQPNPLPADFPPRRGFRVTPRSRPLSLRSPTRHPVDSLKMRISPGR